MNYKLINKKTNIVMVIISFKEKIRKKNGICSILVGSGVGSGSTIPGSGSADPNQHQKEGDPKHSWV